MKRKFKSIPLILLSMLMIISIAATGCGSSKKDAMENIVKADMATENSNKLNFSEGNNEKNDSTTEAKDENASKDSITDSLDRQGKIIRTGIMQMETIKFDETVDSILSKANSMGAYVQNSNISGTRIDAKVYEESRRAELVIRVPKEKFDGFLKDIGTLGSITNKQISTEDVTAKYFDTQAHLKALNIQEERLLELLKKTGELKDIIALEKELSSVRYEIESLTGNLKKWDNLIDFCTLNIEVYEVHQIKENPISLGDKIVNGFNNSIKSLISIGKAFIITLAICLPYIVILLVIYFIIVYVFKFKNKKINIKGLLKNKDKK